MLLFKPGLKVRSPVNAGEVFELRPEHVYRKQFEVADKGCFLCEGGRIHSGGDYVLLVRKSKLQEGDGECSWDEFEFAHTQCARFPNERQRKMLEEGGYIVLE